MTRSFGEDSNGALLPIPTAWPDKSPSDKLASLTEQSLDTIKGILAMPVSADNLKLLSIQKDAALSILSTQVRVDESNLRTRRRDVMDELLRRIREEEAAKLVR